MAYFPNPYAATISRASMVFGASDTYIENGVYKFLGCSIQSCNVSLGYNGTASTMSVSLVQDSSNGDLFTMPSVPYLVGFSLPQGGVGRDIFLPNGTNLDYGVTRPFYFAGLCTAWSRETISTAGKTISVTISDCRDILSKVYCILSGKSLSNAVAAGQERFNVDNIIDVYGYYDGGFESGVNEFGMPWYKAMAAIEACGVKLHDIYCEFQFTGDAFREAPSFYRIEGDIVDVVSLASKVAADAGCDMIVMGHKVTGKILIEFIAVTRNENDPLKRSELSSFISARSEIVTRASLGQEFRNEPTSSMIIGGRCNKNYIAWPSTYDPTIKLTSGAADFNKFPLYMENRLFGGTYSYSKYDETANSTITSSGSCTTSAGSIFPYFGPRPGDFNTPMIEPFIALDKLVFHTRLSLTDLLPWCNIKEKDLTVRVRTHADTFLVNDGDSDSRPFAYVDEISNTEPVSEEGDYWVKGLPLTTELLNVAISSDDQYVFWEYYSLIFPTIAAQIQCPRFDSDKFYALCGKCDTPTDISLDSVLDDTMHSDIATSYTSGTLSEAEVQAAKSSSMEIMERVTFLTLLFEHIRQYALDCLGTKFLVCLPKSETMNRIWDNLPVATRVERPEIEYSVDTGGWWATLPAAIADSEEIRRKFMLEDGRYAPMVVIKNKQTGNASFWSNGDCEVMYKDLPVGSFATADYEDYTVICIQCSVETLQLRPDLAIVTLPGPIYIDTYLKEYEGSTASKPKVFSRYNAAYRLLWRYITSTEKIIEGIQLKYGTSAAVVSAMKDLCAKWAKEFREVLLLPFSFSDTGERLLDLDNVIIPLTSNVISYGPWIADYNNAKGSVQIEVDESLTPWNFSNAQALDAEYVGDDGYTPEERLDIAGTLRLNRSIATSDFIDSASITVAGFPELGNGSRAGQNSNLTTISVDFGTGGIVTTYNFSTYSNRAGTYRKDEYDNVSRSRIDRRIDLRDRDYIPITNSVSGTGINRFKD